MNLLDIVKPDYLCIFHEPCEREEIINRLGMLLTNCGVVEQAYIDAVLAREAEFPTGLELGEIHVAIPHADSAAVKSPAIALGVAKRGVPFRSMAEPEKEIAVHLVILLATQRSEMQLQALEKTMDFVQDPKRLKSLLEAADEGELYTRFVEYLVLEEQ
ncbi:PTS sugar transporter subunit IIA [Brevibacillus humidisoli]|uniref:PTS sugar transporter subunit IIA n=1 Tax=Brevibacillus humidisoli TaxID=2895522 RepID=UPI001E5E50F8|nr:PTS sugar transporter subunit IIA [Brevibacillus humidisoli]UFJ42345.1 PTS sugar transporter subunit IIA [Brevibacillus humidisoli]